MCRLRDLFLTAWLQDISRLQMRFCFYRPPIIKVQGGEMINAKLFEYIGAGRPIIAITPYGEQRSIVEDYRLGYTASPDNILEIRNAIRSCRGSLPDWETSAMERHTDDFDRRALTSKFVAFLRKVRSRTSLVSD